MWNSNECLGFRYIIRKFQLAFQLILNFQWNRLKILKMVFYYLFLSLFCLYSWSDVLGSYAVEERDVNGKAGIFQRGTLILCLGPCMNLPEHLENDYFYGYLIFIYKEWAQDFFPLANYTKKYCDFY